MSKYLEKNPIRKYRDKKGHELNHVSIRIFGNFPTVERIPYFYCKKCDKFTKIKRTKRESVIII